MLAVFKNVTSFDKEQSSGWKVQHGAKSWDLSRCNDENGYIKKGFIFKLKMFELYSKGNGGSTRVAEI